MTDYHYLALAEFNILLDFYWGTWLEAIPNSAEVTWRFFYHDYDESYREASQWRNVYCYSLWFHFWAAINPELNGNTGVFLLSTCHWLAILNLMAETLPSIAHYRMPPYSSFLQTMSAKNIIGFHATISTPKAGPLLQNLPVNFQVGSINTELPSDSQMESLLSDTNLLVLKERDIYHWAVYNKKEEKMQLWGSCDLSSKDDYECLRMIQHNEVNLRYSVHKENIKIYDKIDEFIINNLGQWRCKS